ncbi:MAG: hypothetical protein IPH31_22130 [Lewinellaceae bacterium]|nr:hypothetical protein [Lewinellaceae bacterium]
MLCADIRKALFSTCYQIEDREDDVLAEQLLMLWRNDHPDPLIPIIEGNADRFFSEKQVLDKLNDMPLDQKNQLRAQTDAYFDKVDAAGLKDEFLMQPGQGAWVWLAFLILGFLPFLIGIVLGWPVRQLAQYVTDKKVKKREFRTSILLGIGVLGTFFYGMFLLITGILLGWPILISLALLLPVLTWFAIFWRERLYHWRAARAAMRHPQRDQLLAIRSAISY